MPQESGFPQESVTFGPPPLIDMLPPLGQPQINPVTLGGLPSRVTQDRKSLSLDVCVPGFSWIFTEWYLRRLQTQIPFGLLKQGPKIGPGFRAILHHRNHLAGPDFFVNFSQNVHKIYARPEALMSIPNVLTQEPSRPPRGAICPAGPI